MSSAPFLSSTAYFPPATWLAAARTSGSWQLAAHENYQKGGWRNRCRIIGPNGLQTLTVPLEKGKHQQLPIHEVRISYRNDWWRAHEQAIRTAYGRAPFYEFYAESIFAVAQARPATLWELNQRLLDEVLRLLHWPVKPVLTDAFVHPAAAGYVRPTDFPASLSPYPQVFTDRHGFTPGLSVLDALFCLGPTWG